MTLRRPRYTSVKRGNLFWEPPKWARDLGMTGQALGPDSNTARAEADHWNDRLDKARAERGNVTITMPYPRGSLGHWWLTWKSKESFLRKGDGTRAEFEEAWKRIGPSLGNKRIDLITPSDVEDFQVELENTVTEYRRWSIIKKLRGIFNAAIRYNVLTASPALTLPNPQPKPRQQVLPPGFVDTMAQVASDTGHKGLSLVIRVMYEAAVSPIDARSIQREMLVSRGAGGYLSRPRTKTQAGVANALSDSLWTDIQTYMKKNPAIGDVFRRSDGSAWPDRRAFNYDFAKVRKAAGYGSHLKAMDIRRTANLEAHLGGASKEDRAKFLANTLDVNAKLDATYTPDTVEASEDIAKKRDIGRQILKNTK